MAVISIPATILAAAMMMVALIGASDTNHVFSPCSDTTVQISDGFTLGIAFSSKSSFNGSSSPLSPCDRRLNLAGSAQVALFRPKVDEISILTVNMSLSPDKIGGYMVAFAGRKYAARSPLAFVANSTYTVTSFTLVLEFKKGRLQNLFWKRDHCASCKGNSKFVCLSNQDCAVRTQNCISNGGKDDCSLGIQLAFSGTDKHLSALNSWYEVENLRQYSLFKLYDNLKGTLSGYFV